MLSPVSSAIRSLISISASALILFFYIAAPFQVQAAYDFNEDSGLNTLADDVGYDLQETDINEKIRKGLNLLFSMLGIAFLAMIIYGGVLWMTDQGNAKHKETAKNVINQAVVGLIIVVAAYAITTFVFNYLRNGELTPSTGVLGEEVDTTN